MRWTRPCGKVRSTTTTAPQDIRFIVQAVNGVGLTTLAANQGAFYTPNGFIPNTRTRGYSAALTRGERVVWQAHSRERDPYKRRGCAGEQTVWFGIGAQRVQGITNASGVARGDTLAFGLPGEYHVQASFEGDASYSQSSNLGGLVVTGIVGFTLDSPTASFLILGGVTLLALPLLARLRSPVAALPSSTTPTDSSSDTDPSQHVAL